MSNPYDVPDISMLMRAQMATYRSITDSTKIFWHVSKTMKEAFKGAQQAQKYSETLRKSMIAVPSAKELGYLSNAMNLSSNTGIAEQLKVTYNITSSTASLGSSLREAMKPFFDSHDLKMTSTANNIFNKINNNPTEAYNSLQESLNAPINPIPNNVNELPRDNSQAIHTADNHGSVVTEVNNSFYAAKEIIKKYTDSVKEYYANSADPETALNFFVGLMQFIFFFSFFVNINADTKNAIDISEALCGCIEWALSYGHKHHNDN
ncbi:hypothetical protein [Limosilactobacillus oris]|uniref:hypothetical protein n=1 Tax=Limosilactobacillus oris TaxID=1632 RepID=UPI00195DBDCA|nr:hypothetical protein [Limosilactobacillus oris]VTX56063.1 Uncharacterised protein [Limosilactobacillus oris]